MRCCAARGPTACCGTWALARRSCVITGSTSRPSGCMWTRSLSTWTIRLGGCAPAWFILAVIVLGVAARASRRDGGAAAAAAAAAVEHFEHNRRGMRFGNVFQKRKKTRQNFDDPAARLPQAAREDPRSAFKAWSGFQLRTSTGHRPNAAGRRSTVSVVVLRPSGETYFAAGVLESARYSV